MILYTNPRAMPARYVRLHDEVALLAGNGPDDTPAAQVRAVETARRAGVVWLEVVQAPALIPGEVGVFALLLAPRRPDGTHGALVELHPDEAQQLVIRERVTASPLDALGVGIMRDPALVDYVTGDPAAGLVGAYEVCGAWVDYGPCALGAGHPPTMPHATRNALLSQAIAGEATEGHPAAPGGLTVAVPAPRASTDTEKSTVDR